MDKDTTTHQSEDPLKEQYDCLLSSMESRQKAAFIDVFVSTFLATWCATRYDDYCSRGWQDRLSNPPIEDAEFLAGEIWENKRKQ